VARVPSLMKSDKGALRAPSFHRWIHFAAAPSPCSRSPPPSAPALVHPLFGAARARRLPRPARYLIISERAPGRRPACTPRQRQRHPTSLPSRGRRQRQQASLPRQPACQGGGGGQPSSARQGSRRFLMEARDWLMSFLMEGIGSFFLN